MKPAALLLTEASRKTLLDRLMKEHPDQQVHTIDACDLCGTWAWAQSVKGEVPTLIIREQDAYRLFHCQTCQTFRFKHPEVFDYILSVLSFQIGQLELRAEAKMAEKDAKSA